MPLPLASFPIISTEDIDEAQAILSREMASLQFQRVCNPKDFRLTMNGVHIGKTMIGCNRFDSETEIEAGVIEDTLMLTISVGPPTVPVIDGEPVAPDRGAVTAPSRHLRIHREAGSEILILKTSIQAIEQQFQDSMGWRPEEPFLFEPSVDLTQGVGSEVRRWLKGTMEQLLHDRSVLQYPLLRQGLDDLLLNALMSLPNNYSCAISNVQTQTYAPRLVQEAESYMESNRSKPIGISDVASVCNCSRRTLFAAFQKHRGYTPMTFLTNARLELARQLLQSPKSVGTVARVAHQCGFLHAGRFSAVYRQRFGESPSQTLRMSGNCDRDPRA